MNTLLAAVIEAAEIVLKPKKKTRWSLAMDREFKRLLSAVPLNCKIQRNASGQTIFVRPKNVGLFIEDVKKNLMLYQCETLISELIWLNSNPSEFIKFVS